MEDQVQGLESQVCLVFLGTPPSSTTRGTAAMVKARWRPTSGQRTRRWCRPTGGVRTWSTRKDGHAWPPDLSEDSSCCCTPCPAPPHRRSVLCSHWHEPKDPRDSCPGEKEVGCLSAKARGSTQQFCRDTSEDGSYLIPEEFRCPC